MSSNEASEAGPLLTLMSAVRQERNDAIASLASARAELELLREEMSAQQKEAALRSRRSPELKASPFRRTEHVAETTHYQTREGGSDGNDDSADAAIRAQRALLKEKESALELRHRILHRLQSSPSPRRTEQQRIISPDAADEEGDKQRFLANLAKERRVDDEVAAALRRTKDHIQAVEEELHQRNEELGAAKGRIQHLELQLQDTLGQLKRQTIQMGDLQQSIAREKEGREVKSQECHSLKLELQDVLQNSNVHLDRIADLQATIERLTASSRADDDHHAQQLRAHQSRVGELEVEVGLLRFNLERTEEDWRQKVVAISKELATVRDQRDKAMTPYFAKPMDSVVHASPATNSSAFSWVASDSAKPMAIGPRRDLFSPTGIGSSRTGVNSPSSARYTTAGATPPSTVAGRPDELTELRKQVQWLTDVVKERSSPSRRT